ncbi:MAG TPA: hypothetical protein VGA77_13300 [Propylenella sp.]
MLAALTKATATMRPAPVHRPGLRLAVLPLASLLVALPVRFEFGTLPFAVDTASAKDGGNSGSGGGDDSGYSGPGGGDDGGHSGHGGDDDRDSGRGDDSGSESDDRSGSDRRLILIGPHGERIESSRGKIEVLYPDGYREKLDGGRLEMRDPRGRLIIRRSATTKDRARLDGFLN